ncbi:MAG: hypothetical protein ACD_22C00081G0007 [uncultured bacterium]|nr:MAG: hypothetical protein ACD_22C00081G0007 [uncultured bacterium]
MTPDLKNTSAKNLWEIVQSELKQVMSPNIYGTTIALIEAKNLTKTSIELICRNKYIKEQVEKKYLTFISATLNRVGNANYEILLTVSEYVKALKEDKQIGPLFAQEEKHGPSEIESQAEAYKIGLSAKYTFENFLMGTNNQLAYAVATAVAVNPGKVYNPLFLYSGVGLGKTHLMQAVGNRILKEKPELKIVYCTGESFTNELIENLQKGKRNGKYTSNEFRDKYRKADVLLIDDIQFIAGKVSTQEEFFHTLDALLRTQRQIIITSDRPPKDFVNIEERITSRIGSGMIADIQAPDFEMRNAILRKKRDENIDPISNDVLSFIAEKVATNIRELEGAYLQVVTKGKAKGRELTMEFAAEALGESINIEPQKNINISQILKAVCTYYSVKASDVKGERRVKEFVLPRQVAMFLIKEMTRESLMGIGDYLGGRDHTTVIHGAEKIEKEMQEMGKLHQDVVNIRQMISAK